MLKKAVQTRPTLLRNPRQPTTPNYTQQYATGCANGRNMQHPTMLGVVDQQCCTVCMGLKVIPW